MSVSDFRTSEVREIQQYIEGYRRREIAEWKRTRWQTWTLMQLMLKKGHGMKETDLLRLADEDDQVDGQKMTMAEANKIFAKWDAHDAKLKTDE